MNLSNYVLNSLSDPRWIEHYISKMGEKEFWEYKKKVYQLFEKLEVGQSVPVEAWVKPESYDLFIKIVCCFVSESNCCYQINPEYTTIKRNFDASTLERSLTLLRLKRRSQEIAGNGRGTGSESGGTTLVLTPEPAIQSLLKG